MFRKQNFEEDPYDEVSGNDYHPGNHEREDYGEEIKKHKEEMKRLSKSKPKNRNNRKPTPVDIENSIFNTDFF